MLKWLRVLSGRHAVCSETRADKFGVHIAALLLIVQVLTGCASTFSSQRFDATTWEPVDPEVEGVIYYEPHQVVVTYKFSALVDKEKGVIGTSSEGVCVEVIQKEELVIEPNFAAPRVILNKPSNFSASKLSVTLSNGMLASVNSESTPKSAELLEQVTALGAATGIGTFVVGAKPACNASPVVRAKREPPSLDQ